MAKKLSDQLGDLLAQEEGSGSNPSPSHTKKSSETHKEHTEETHLHHDESVETDGGFWQIFYSLIAGILIFGIIMIYVDNTIINILLSLIIIISLAVFSKGAKLLQPNERGCYLYFGKFTNRYTPQGGWIFVIPFAEEIVIVQVGVFTIDIPYADLTLPNGDNAKGIVQLTLEIDPKFFHPLYDITGGHLSKTEISSVIEKKLKEQIPAQLKQVVKSAGTPDGLSYEENANNFAKSLQKLITKDNGHCMGLKLKAIEIPTPEMSGEGYLLEIHTKAEKKRGELLKASANKFNTYLDAFREQYMSRRNKKTLTEAEEDKILLLASQKYDQENTPESKRNNYTGLGNNTIITGQN